MGVMTLSRDDVIVRAGPFSRAERDALPDDGRRHELLDGVLLVARRIDVTDRDLPTAPLLAVEVLSASTRLFDLGRKKELLEQAGCPSYWVIDTEGPELTAWELRDGCYVEVARVSATQSWTATAPYDVTITPRDLLDD